jgi:hypothetical protein
MPGMIDGAPDAYSTNALEAVADASRIGHVSLAGQDYETRYEARKTGRAKSEVKKAAKRFGNNRKPVERSLSR